MVRLSGRAPRLDPDPTGSGWLSSQDLLWISEVRPEPSWWASLRAQHERTGLWPLILGSLSADAPGRPWQDKRDLRPDRVRTTPDSWSPDEVLARWWSGVEPEEELRETIEPFVDGWPGLARPGVRQEDPDQRAAGFADFLIGSGWLTTPRLGLIPGSRGADALTDVGWTGPTNHDNDTAKLSAVLRSWEERFGARVVGAGFATLCLSVAAPPVDQQHALPSPPSTTPSAPTTSTRAAVPWWTMRRKSSTHPPWVFWWD